MRDDSSVGLVLTIVFAVIFLSLFDVAKGAEPAPAATTSHRDTQR